MSGITVWNTGDGIELEVDGKRYNPARLEAENAALLDALEALLKTDGMTPMQRTAEFWQSVDWNEIPAATRARFEARDLLRKAGRLP